MQCGWVSNLSGDHFVSYVNIELLCCTPETHITLTVNCNFYKRGLLSKVAISWLPEAWLSGGCAPLSIQMARPNPAHNDAVYAETCFPSTSHTLGRGCPSDQPSIKPGLPSPVSLPGTEHITRVSQLAAGEIAPIPCDCAGRGPLKCASGFLKPPSCASALCGPGSATFAVQRLQDC